MYIPMVTCMSQNKHPWGSEQQTKLINMVPEEMGIAVAIANKEDLFVDNFMLSLEFADALL